MRGCKYLGRGYCPMMASIGEIVSDNETLIKDQGRRVPEELQVRRSAMSEGGRIETVINIKIGICY